MLEGSVVVASTADGAKQSHVVICPCEDEEIQVSAVLF
jgi:hypothetical protein